MLLSGKLNKIRTLALLLIFAGLGVMYIGFLLPSLIAFFFILGMILVLMSVGIYFGVGMLSTQAVKVTCPECKRTTKMLGKRDQCMYCKALLSLDPKDKKATSPSS